VFPGLGHWKAGRAPDGLARGVLFAMLFSMALMMFAAGVTSGALFGVFGLFMGGALVVYVGSAAEAYRIAQGGGPLVSSRALLWATVALVMLSVALLATSVATSMRR
jgi:hypothetical protein